MCDYDISKRSVKLCVVFFCAYLQLGSCGMKLLRQLGHRHIFYGDNTNFVANANMNSNQSPCPNVFEYRYDDFGTLYGFLEVAVPNTRGMELEVEFCLGNHVNKGNEGSISLPYLNNQQIIDSIQQRKPLNYKVNFPAWRGYQPRITKIILNGNVLCIGQPYTTNSVPILTTINLRHKLQVNVTPLFATISNPNNDLNFNIDNIVIKGDDASPIFAVRNDNSIASPGNPYNFKPTFPRKVPEIILKPGGESTDNPYSKNPFLNSLSTTRSPDRSFGGNNQFVSKPSTTEKIFPDLTLQNRGTAPPTNPNVNQEDETSQDLSQVCGRPVVTNSLVLHGHKVPRGAFPWLVAMFMITNSGLEYKCSGSLISKRHVVTAAHCVKPGSYVLDPEKIVLIMGRLNILGWGSTEGERIIGAEQLFVFPNYTSKTADADVAVIMTKGEVKFSVFIRPICVWLNDIDLNLVVGKRGVVVGWGMDENGHKVSPEPKQIELPIVSQEQCLRSSYSFSEITSENTFCAGDRNGSGPCNGDSGGGFIMKKNDRWHLRGIVSMSLSAPDTVTCDLHSYVVFTDASKYGYWLKTFIK